MSAAADRLIVALDFTAPQPALAMARRLAGLVRIVKVGSALFTAAGPTVIQRLRRLGFAVMLDLKFHDIPSTVELSCRAAARHRAVLLTVHAAGEAQMLEAAVRGARSEAARRRLPRPLVLGVTVLTSVRGASGVSSRVRQLAAKALKAGCDGVVASAQEAPALRRRFGRRLKIVCPGIRPAHARAGDQQRIVTPAAALAAGADWLVIGRPITGARHPRRAVSQLLDEMEGADAC
jgi:orotidine-5'-phosphate decarboxylase